MKVFFYNNVDPAQDPRTTQGRSLHETRMDPNDT